MTDAGGRDMNDTSHQLQSGSQGLLAAAGRDERRKAFPRDHPILEGINAFILRNAVLDLYQGASGDQCLLFLLLCAFDCYLCKKREASLGLSLCEVEMEKMTPLG